MSWTLAEIQLATFTIRHLNNRHYFSDERWNLGLCSIAEQQHCGLSDVLLTLKFHSPMEQICSCPKPPRSRWLVVCLLHFAVLARGCRGCWDHFSASHKISPSIS